MVTYHKYRLNENQILIFETFRDLETLSASRPVYLPYSIVGNRVDLTTIGQSYPYNILFEYNNNTGESRIIEGNIMTKYYAPKKKQQDGTLFIRVVDNKRTLFATDTKEPTTINPVGSQDWKEITSEQAMDCLETNTPISTVPTYRSETRGIIVIEEMVDEHLLNAVRKSIKQIKENRIDGNDVDELVDLVYEVGVRGLTL